MAQERWRKKSGADWARKSFSWFSSIHVIRAITSRAFLSRGYSSRGHYRRCLECSGNGRRGTEHTVHKTVRHIGSHVWWVIWWQIMWQQMKPCDNVTLTDLQPVLHIHQTNCGGVFVWRPTALYKLFQVPPAHIYHLDHTHAISQCA